MVMTKIDDHDDDDDNKENIPYPIVVLVEVADAEVITASVIMRRRSGV